LAAKLTAKQEMFCQEYLVDLNATQAALRAGYSKKTAAVIACENLTKPKIAARLTELKAERLDRITCDQDYLLRRLLEEAEADLADLYHEDGAMKPIHQWPLIWRQGLMAGLDVQQMYAYEDGHRVPDGVVLKAKLSDRTKRLEMLGRHIGFFNDKLTIAGDPDNPVKVDTPWAITPVKVVERTS
jgi:phage terminase small subunit